MYFWALEKQQKQLQPRIFLVFSRKSIIPIIPSLKNTERFGKNWASVVQSEVLPQQLVQGSIAGQDHGATHLPPDYRWAAPVSSATGSSRLQDSIDLVWIDGIDKWI